MTAAALSMTLVQRDFTALYRADAIPRDFERGLKMLRGLQSLADRWDRLSEDERTILRDLAYQLLDPPTPMKWWGRIRSRFQVAAMLVRHGVPALVHVMTEYESVRTHLIDTVLNAVERGDDELGETIAHVANVAVTDTSRVAIAPDQLGAWLANIHR